MIPLTVIYKNGMTAENNNLHKFSGKFDLERHAHLFLIHWKVDKVMENGLKLDETWNCVITNKYDYETCILYK